MDFKAYKQEVFQTTMDLVAIDLIRMSSGNISSRLPDGNIAITPSGVLYARLQPEDIVIMDLESQVLEGEFKPSSEWQLHTEIYKALPDVNAVVHVHSRYAIAMGAVGLEIPVCNIEIWEMGGPIPVAPFQIPGTQEVGLGAAKLFQDRPTLRSLLLQNHGMVAIGKDLLEAYQNAYKTEIGVEIYHHALVTSREVRVLSEAEIEEIWRVYKKPEESQ
ncbi:MAG: class II aldolase/adducin family protein [Anaerolineales bacterium]